MSNIYQDNKSCLVRDRAADPRKSALTLRPIRARTLPNTMRGKLDYSISKQCGTLLGLLVALVNGVNNGEWGIF
jgi:hypothetical protein